MQEYGFSLILIFPCKDRIMDSFHIQENTGQRKLEFWHISRSASKLLIRL